MGNFPKSWNVQKINILIAVGWITEEFSYFSMSECIALLPKTYWYIINISGFHLTVLLSDLSTGKTKDESTYSCEDSPALTWLRQGTGYPQEGKLTWQYFHFWLTAFKQTTATHALPYACKVLMPKAWEMKNPSCHTWALSKHHLASLSQYRWCARLYKILNSTFQLIICIWG